jgi:hypothetical protein
MASTLTNGSSVQFTLKLTVVCATRNGTVISNTAAVTSATLNPNPNPQNSASLGIVVSDPPPVIAGLAISQPVLWPPNHMLVSETLNYGVTATCDPNPKLAVSVSTNQVDTDGEPDWVIQSARQLELAAERSAPNARIYTVTVTATDSAGATSSGSVNVTVPLSQGTN